MKKICIFSLATIICLSGCQPWNLDTLEFVEIATLDVSNITLRTATVVGNVKSIGSNQVTHHGFCWSAINPKPEIKDDTLELGTKTDEGNFVGTLGQLAINQIYFVRAYAIWEGKISYGEARTFQTNTISLIMNQNVDISNGGATVTGGLIGLDTGQVVSDYGHCWSTDTMQPTLADAHSSWGQKMSDGLFTSFLADLRVGERYYVRSYAVIEQTVVYSNALSFIITDVWGRIADMPGECCLDPLGFSVGGKGYILVTGASYTQFIAYDPNTDTWTQKADFAGESRSYAVAFALDNRGYIGTGYGRSNQKRLADFWEYNPVSNAWSKKADFGGGGRSGASGFAIDKSGYVGLGHDESAYKSDFWAYDPATDSWSQLANFKGAAREFAISFSVQDKGYVGQGYSSALNDLWAYDPAHDQWSLVREFPDGHRFSPYVFVINDKAYIGGGTNFSNVYNDLWEYDPVKDNWIRRAELPSGGKEGGVSFSIGNRAYVGLGSNGLFPGRDFWVYVPAN